MIKRLYNHIITLAGNKRASWWLVSISFAEASIFPIPPDPLLMSMILAKRDQAWKLASICTFASVMGGVAGWLLGAYFLNHIAIPIIHTYHGEATMISLQERFREYGIWIILLKGFTPIPFKIITIASGAAFFPIVPFIICCLITRGLRFFLIAALLYYFGSPIRSFIENRLGFVSTIFLIFLIGGSIILIYV